MCTKAYAEAGNPAQAGWLQVYNRDSGISFAEVAAPVGADKGLLAEIILNGISQSSGAFSVYHADGVQMGHAGIVEDDD